MTIGNNLRALLALKDMNQEAFARHIGKTQGAVSGWLNGRRSPSMKTIDAICEAFGVTTEDIVSDTRGLYAKLHGLAPEEGAQPIGTSAMVPLLGYTHMGEPADEDSIERRVEVPACVAEAHPGCYAVHAEGGCMDNRYPSDSVLLIDAAMMPRNGCAVLAETHDYQSIVRVYNRGTSTLMLSADSHSGEYDDIVVRPDDPPVTIKGVVIWYQAEEDVRTC